MSPKSNFFQNSNDSQGIIALKFLQNRYEINGWTLFILCFAIEISERDLFAMHEMVWFVTPKDSLACTNIGLIGALLATRLPQKLQAFNGYHFIISETIQPDLGKY